MAVKKYDLAKDLEATGIGDADITRLAGVDKSTVWRWHQGNTPEPIKTILRQQRRIKALTSDLAAIREGGQT